MSMLLKGTARFPRVQTPLARRGCPGPGALPVWPRETSARPGQAGPAAFFPAEPLGPEQSPAERGADGNGAGHTGGTSYAVGVKTPLHSLRAGFVPRAGNKKTSGGGGDRGDQVASTFSGKSFSHHSKNFRQPQNFKVNVMLFSAGSEAVPVCAEITRNNDHARVTGPRRGSDRPRLSHHRRCFFGPLRLSCYSVALHCPALPGHPCCSSCQRRAPHLIHQPGTFPSFQFGLSESCRGTQIKLLWAFVKESPQGSWFCLLLML
ncbi:uncharacterized protein LOC134561531 [Prinia subflava]|uniref:uncharacterized protein LOC134561531 n=1 Tax=Prinia subflava TaxID=208062 RepID=UPI002FE181BE